MNIAIIDKKEEIRNRVQECLENYYFQNTEEEITCVHFFSGEQFLREIKNTNFQLAILDMEIPGKKGIEIKEYLERKFEIYIIVLADYTRFMSQAFGRNVCGFLKKPIIEEELWFCLERIQGYREEERTIYVKERRESFKIRDIVALKAENHYSVLCMNDGKEILTRKYLSVWEKELEKMDFFRVHRSYLVNLAHVESIEKETILKDGSKVKIARGKKEGLKNAFFSYIRKHGRYI